MHFIAFFAASVLPAPLSPLITMAWFLPDLNKFSIEINTKSNK